MSHAKSYSTIPYGNPPKVLGEIDLNPTEHMLYLYLPILMPGKMMQLPKRLDFIRPLIKPILMDVMEDRDLFDKYVYVTAKTCWVEPGAPGNRPGWHADGFGSDGDLNYIWYDMNPTEFAMLPFSNIPTDDMAMLAKIEEQINIYRHIHLGGSPSFDPIVTYPNKTLLRLDESVVHRVNPNPKPGLRTFIKISVSKHKYNLKGNSHNYLFDYDWKMFDRADIRNTDNKDFVKSK